VSHQVTRDNLRLPAHVKNFLSWKRLSNLRGDAFYSNSMYLTLSRMTAAGTGLVFWIIAAWFYSQTDVGTATTLISASTLVATIALLGTNQSMIRYFPTYDKSRILGTALRITSYCSLLIGVIFLVATAWWAPDLVMTGSYMLFFILLCWATTIIFVTGYAFTAERKAKHTFVQQMVLSSRVLLLLPLVILGALGIVVSITLSSVLVVIYSSYVLIKLGLRAPRIDWSFLKESVWFSAGSYVSALLLGLPALSMPLVVYGRLGAAEVAVYFMASSIASLAAIVPAACSDALFVEGSHGEQFRSNALKSLKTSYLIQIPLAIGLFIFGGWLLGTFGQGYASGGTEVLRLLVISTFFYTLFVIILSWAKINKEMKALVVLSLVSCLSTIGLSYLLIGPYGVNGIGYAFIISYLVATMVGAGIIVARRTKISPARSG
jgi:O-antigen/teichoic acid export membrane protein